MKKISLALATAGLTACLGAYAAIPTDAQPYQVVVPNIKGGLDITLEGFLWQPNNSNLDYANVQTFNAASAPGTFNFNQANNVSTLNPDWDLGFRVGLGYVFPNSGNDVQIAWTHFNHTSNDTTTAPANSLLTSQLGNPVIVNGPFSDVEKFVSLVALNTPIYDAASVTSSQKFKLDAIDLDMGQFVDIGTRLRLRMFAGARFAQVKSDQTSTTTALGSFEVNPPGPADDLIVNYSEVNTETFNSKFSGVGPRFGVDSSYHLGNCFGIVGHAAMALLIGQTDTSTTSNNVFASSSDFSNDGVVSENSFVGTTNNSVNSDNLNRIVPAFDAKLGLNYSHIFANESVLTLEGGWQATQYIDAVDKLTVDGFNNIVRTTSNVSFDGPYVTLNWKV